MNIRHPILTRTMVLMALVALAMAGCEKKNQDAPKAGAGTGEEVESTPSEPAEQSDTGQESRPEGSAGEVSGEESAGEASEDDSAVDEASDLPPLSPESQAFVEQATHFIVVVTPEWSSPTGRLALFERDGDGWKVVHSPIPTNVGYRGISWGRGLTMPPEGAERVKKEGDKTAPAGLFRVSTAMGYDPEPPAGLQIPYQQVDKNTHCVDDADSPKYNRIVQLDEGEDPEWSSSEILRREDALYHTLLLIDHNGLTGEADTVPGAGSCIFLHEWGGEDTATVGCTSVEASQLADVLTALPSLKKTVFVQFPREIYADAESTWGLPPMPSNQDQ